MVAALMKTSLAAALLGGVGIAIAADATDNVTLRGLDIDVAAIVADATEAARAARNDAIGRLVSELDLDAQDDVPLSAFIDREMGHPREIVKNAPYTAEAVTETVRTLADGNRIVHRTTTLLARDGYGRSRQERKGSHGNAVWINDPMRGHGAFEQRHIVVKPAAPSAPPPPAAAPAPPAPPPPGAAPAPPAPGAAPKPPAVTEVSPGRIVVRRGGDKGEDVRVEVIRIGREVGAPPMQLMPPLALPSLPRRKGETRDLGTRDFDGIKATGTQTSYTIPAGEIGNEKPIVVSSERWFSPELHVVVYAKTSDPRAGETTYRLTNVKRGEPPADLFREK